MTRPAVVIPTYNNAGSIGVVVAGAVRSGLPVVVVDDGSMDGSGERAREAGAEVVVHGMNQGKGRALLTAMRHLAARGFTHAICLDADGQHDPADVPVFAAAVKADPAAIFAGVRDLATAPGISRFGRRFSNFWIWVETGWRVADSQCGFRAYPLAPVLALGLSGGRYDLEVEVLTRALWRGTPVRDLPCRVYYPPPDERVTSFRPFVDNARISWMNARLVVRRLVDPRLWAPARARDPWAGGSRGTALGWRFVVALLRLFGRKAAYVFVDGLAAWYALFAKGPREVVERYQDRLGVPTGAFRVFRAFARALVDRFSFLLYGPPAFRYEREGVQVLVDLFTRGEGAVLLSAHLGNIEASSGDSGTRERIHRIHAVRFVAAGDHGNEVFAAFPDTWRPPVIVVNREEGFAALSIVRALRAGAVVAMHGDRLVDDRFVRATFLGHPVDVPAGPWLVAALARVPVVVVGNFKEGADTYRMIAAPPMYPRFERGVDRDLQVAAWAQAYLDIVAAWARRYPDQWCNFHPFWVDERTQPAAAAADVDTSSRT